ncbi:MAG: pectate lyase [Bacteroidales bacterium]|nr:pectate lyase [Bacteroidales bacterium]
MKLKSIISVRTLCLISWLLTGPSLSVQADTYQPTRDDVLDAMHRATQYMMDSVSLDGAFVWEYAADGSRQWGELEAPYRTMVWLQAPGTPSMGHMLLDALHATGDDYYYDQAMRVARVLMRVQHPEGGWNYVEDLAGEKELRHYYATIGRQAWRLEEFQHYYGNCTFDDEATIVTAKFLLRLYLERHDKVVGESLNRVIQFVLDSQYANGGWPQRWPLRHDHLLTGRHDYSSYITLNDNVMMNNVEFLLQCYQTLERQDLFQPILRAMYLLSNLQQPEPLAGWADQYDPETLLPAHARSYEPRAVNTATTLRMLRVMGQYYQLTGDAHFIRGLRSAVRFVREQSLPHEYESVWQRPKRDSTALLLPRFVSPDNAQPLFVHRRGSNVGNGRYYVDQDLHSTIGHYSSAVYVNLNDVEDACSRMEAWSPDSLRRTSVLLHPDSSRAVPHYYYTPNVYHREGPLPHTAEGILQLQSPSGAWIVPIVKDSHPYKPLPRHQRRSRTTEYASSFAGDEYDTSVFYPEAPFLGVSTSSYIRMMSCLVDWLRGQ